jgi:hypothetical protein
VLAKKEIAKLAKKNAVDRKVSSSASANSDVAKVRNPSRKKGATKYFAMNSSRTAGIVESNASVVLFAIVFFSRVREKTMQYNNKCLIAAIVIVVLLVIVANSRTRENWFGSDAWNWTKKTFSKAGKATAKAAGKAWDGIVYITTKPAFSDAADYQKSMLDWVGKSDNPFTGMTRLGLGMLGEVGVMGFDTAYGVAQMPFKTARYAFDADYRDHVFDHGDGWGTWFDSSYDDTLHPLPAGRGHLAKQHHKIPFLPIRW